MPFQSINDLPGAAPCDLPQDAQEIYKQAFNEAWEKYRLRRNRRNRVSREAVAHRVAWSAVQEKCAGGTSGAL